MNIGPWRAEFEREYLTSRYNVYLFSGTGDSRTFLCKDGVGKTIPYGESTEKSDVIFAQMTQEQLQAMIDGLSELGLKTNRDSIAEGKLQATEKHLDDMRRIVLSKYPEHESNKV